MPVASPGAPPGRVFYGRTVVTAAGLVLFMAYGTQYAFGVFFAALVEEFGWSRASVSGVFSLYAALYSGFALMAGRLTDRWGPRTVIAIGGALLGAGLVAMSRVGVLWQPYLLYGTIGALGMSTAHVPCNATVAKWFTRRRGLAVGLASAGGSLGTFALPPVARRARSRASPSRTPCPRSTRAHSCSASPTGRPRPSSRPSWPTSSGGSRRAPSRAPSSPSPARWSRSVP
jgi:Major Facilitator Superfamily